MNLPNQTFENGNGTQSKQIPCLPVLKTSESQTRKTKPPASRGETVNFDIIDPFSEIQSKC